MGCDWSSTDRYPRRVGDTPGRPEPIPRRGPGWQLIRHTNSRGASRLHIVRYDVEDTELVDQFSWHVRPDHRTFYAAASVSARLALEYGEYVYMHQVIMGEGPGRICHLNGDGLDNRRVNLRRLTQAEILAGRRGERNASSRYKGVTWDRERRKWLAQFRGKKLGRFRDEQEAARAFDDAAYAHWGRLAYLNFPERYPPEPPADPDPAPDAAPSRDRTAVEPPAVPNTGRAPDRARAPRRTRAASSPGE